MTPLARAILKTLIFFDAQDMPLTISEIQNYLVAESNLPEDLTLTRLADTIVSELSGVASLADGFYFITGRENLLTLRQERYKISLMRFRRTRRWLRGLRFLPYLRAVAVSGSQALLNSQNDSDIDLFLITKPNRIWLTRLLVSLYFQILGQRRYGQQIRNRFCLNHYLCEGATISQDQNLYTAVEYANLLPVLGVAALGRFWAQNGWIRNFLHQPFLESANPFVALRFSPVQKALEYLLDFTIGPLLNWLSGIYQKRRIKLQEYIMVTDQELSFHPGSRGQRILASYQGKLVGYQKI